MVLLGLFSIILGLFWTIFDCFGAWLGIGFPPRVREANLIVFGPPWGLFDSSRGARPLAWQGHHNQRSMGSKKAGRGGEDPGPYERTKGDP